MLAGSSIEQLYKWMAYASIEPFGDERADLRSAIISYTVANALAGKGAKSLEIEDFMPKFNQPKKRQTDKEIEMIFRGMYK